MSQRTPKTSCFETLVKVRSARIVLFASIPCATRRPHLDLKVGFIHCVLFHRQPIASMSPLVSQLISMEAPETSSHTLVSPSMAPLLLGSRVSTLFPVFFPSKQKNRTSDFPLDWFCWAHLPRRSGCKGWSTSGYTAAGRTSQSPRDGL